MAVRWALGFGLLLVLLWGGCVELRPLSPSDTSCVISSRPVITSASLYQETFGQAGGLACLRVSWEAEGEPQVVGHLVRLAAQGKLQSFDLQTKAFAEDAVSVSLPPAARGKPLARVLWFFGRKRLSSSLEELHALCTGELSSPAARCLPDEEGDCWFAIKLQVSEGPSFRCAFQHTSNEPALGEPPADVALSGVEPVTEPLTEPPVSDAGDAGDVGPDLTLSKKGWAIHGGSTGLDRANDVAVDLQGNVYIVGGFSGVIAFGSSVLTSKGGLDIFVAKSSPTGKWLWAYSYGSKQDDEATAAAFTTAPKEAIVFAGYFHGQVDLGITTFSSKGGRDLFVGKIESDGTGTFAREAGSTGDDLVTGVAVGSGGNIYITGHFEQSISFGATKFTSKGKKDMFLAKVGSLGAWGWARHAGSTEDCLAHDVVADGKGLLAIVGECAGRMTFNLAPGQTLTIPNRPHAVVGFINTTLSTWSGSLFVPTSASSRATRVTIDSQGKLFLSGSFQGAMSFGSSNLQATGTAPNMFVASYQVPTKSWNWANMAIGQKGVAPTGLALGSNGEVVITGWFAENATFGMTQVSAPGHEAFVAKLTAGGDWMWVQHTYSVEDSESLGVAVGSDDSIYITGRYKDKLYPLKSRPTMPDGQLNLPFLLSGDGSEDVFLAKLDAGGRWEEGYQAGSIGSDRGYSVDIDTNGDVVFTGNFYGNAVFGGTTLQAKGDVDVFVSRVDNEGKWKWSQSLGGLSEDAARGVVVDRITGDGAAYVFGVFVGNTRIGKDTLSAEGGEDGFVARIDKDGNWLWARSFGGVATDKVWSGALNKSGELILCGSFQGSAAFSSSSTTLSSRGASDVFVASIDKEGKWLWAISAGGAGTDICRAVIQYEGDVYVGGEVGKSASTFGNITLPDDTDSSLFVAQVEGTSWRWVSRAKSPGGTIQSLSADTSGQLYVGGLISSPTTFDKISLTNRNLDGFVASLNTSDGKWLWAKTPNNNARDAIYGVRALPTGGAFVVGTFRNKMNLGSSDLLGVGLSDDIFIGQIDKNGVWTRGLRVGSSKQDYVFGLTIDAVGNLYVTGAVSSGATMGSGLTLTFPGASDAFLLKIGSL